MIAAMPLAELLRQALARRTDLLARLHAEGTDCYRLLHGTAEGAPGLTIDRYGSLLLMQTFREPVAAAVVDQLAALVQKELGLDLAVACNHRGAAPPPEFVAHEPTAAALAEHQCHERGATFLQRARHRGQDPWLFLDFRSGRARIEQLSAGKRVLNLFAYTCGIGIAAVRGGTARVQNVDFAQSALDIGLQNAAANGCADARFVVLKSDCLPVLRQLAGIPVQRRGKHVPFVPIAREPFDLIVLDPPRLAKTPFGTIDVVHDYQSLFKPALLALADGGAVLATNHVPNVMADPWHDALRRCATKAGRPLRDLEPIAIDSDFPSFDGQPPLKLALARI